VLRRACGAYPQLALQLRGRRALCLASPAAASTCCCSLEAPLGDVESLPLFRDEFVLAAPSATGGGAARA
jgi:hypothetical protein